MFFLFHLYFLKIKQTYLCQNFELDLVRNLLLVFSVVFSPVGNKQPLVKETKRTKQTLGILSKHTSSHVGFLTIVIYPHRETI